MARLIREVMTRNVEVIGPNDTVREAARKMRDLDVGPLPICDGKRVQGMITDRDIVVRAIAEDMDPVRTPVSAIMSKGIQYCFEDDQAEDVLERMEELQVRRFIVVDRDKKLVGIVALGDLAGEESGHRVGKALEGISEPASH
ncbi:CBS domain-containing protein [Cystobacter ferrugineus]|uniref:Inosine-5-monophosphate dehydrogenase n=1 Tax=Cystobacter ferrugineus TaxID=83449 RepID=A0A1L9AX86_9BACT|nr:CBS domain-containing protein [Cystobacter ferrugineus]OJH34533.1 inosine-5-monophosphate dehydrogenase [Cystobacter ferrugineus]